MECPNCHFVSEGESVECPRCGIIYDKFQARSASPASLLQERASSGESYQFKEMAAQLLFHEPLHVSPVAFYARLALFVILFVWALRFTFSSIEGNYAGESLMHLVNLPFHEAGHVIFRPFGRFITSLGGTLGQLLMPLICAGVFLIQTRDAFAGSVALWWFGQNFFDIAPYINDARSGTLPLLGGNTGQSSPYGFHDWEFLLTESGLLQYDHGIARGAHVTGILIVGVALVWGGYLLLRQYRIMKEG